MCSTLSAVAPGLSSVAGVRWDRKENLSFQGSESRDSFVCSERSCMSSHLVLVSYEDDILFAPTLIRSHLGEGRV